MTETRESCPDFFYRMYCRLDRICYCTILTRWILNGHRQMHFLTCNQCPLQVIIWQILWTCEYNKKIIWEYLRLETRHILHPFSILSVIFKDVLFCTTPVPGPDRVPTKESKWKQDITLPLLHKYDLLDKDRFRLFLVRLPCASLLRSRHGMAPLAPLGLCCLWILRFLHMPSRYSTLS